jgi:hypothetical protein
MNAAKPGSPLPLAPEVVTKALAALENEPEVARLLAGCELCARRSSARSQRMAVFFLPLELTIVAPRALLARLEKPEVKGRIRHAIDSALVSPAVISELTLWPDDVYYEL